MSNGLCRSCNASDHGLYRNKADTWIETNVESLQGFGQVERDSSGQNLARWISASFYLEMSV